MENVWHHRKVAETAAKSCFICYKPSSSVLITPDSKDFFYICPSHLKDRNFAVPTDDEAKAVAERKKKEELDRAIESVKKEYEEKMKKKKQQQQKDKDKDKDATDKAAKDKDDNKASKDMPQDEKERDDKIKALTDKAEASSKAAPAIDDGPRVFQLQKHVPGPPSAASAPHANHDPHHRNFYNMRLEKKRNAEAAKRNLDRLRNPSTFPSVPTNNP